MMTGQEILEIKRTLDGRELRFPCTLLERTPGWVALRYELPHPSVVGSLRLPAGTETIAHYWPDRPYTAYHWIDEQGRTLGIYLNAATAVEIGSDAVRWQDLALDVLVTAASGVEVLDDDEARDAPEWARPAIVAARAHLVTHAAAIAAEVARLSATVRTGAAGGRRK
ncbi:MAG: hypothetical protein A2Z07_12405 [Armatimonadetes bacterium RBG_16_67_12]|nr:MAG: hypothetical protein A2Z07_12405 [Armatimonadetes bacterium RBG_16_67_12]